ncbi:toll/interleukin-1 receptor domain-containing protein [Sorangium sp. So ce1099]|uniref:toll/interleukin-1 receptor domain-containing protein n=1 Tax=Sorangium sp. So ce1099 TaxID=3133331 RepID=UPI003F5DE650
MSYSHADVVWLERLKVHLRPLVRAGDLDQWDDTRILPGADAENELSAAIARAHVAVLLVSPDFLACDAIVRDQLPVLLRRANAGGVLILPVIVNHCLIDRQDELARYRPANLPERPLSAMSFHEAEATLVSLAQRIDAHLRTIEASPHSPRWTAQRAEAAPDEEHSDPYQPASVQFVVERRPDDSLPDLAEAEPLERPINLSFDGPSKDGFPLGWSNSVGYVAGASFEYTVEVVRRSSDRTAGTCAVLARSHARPGEFGALMQRCSARFLAGRTVRLEGELLTREVVEWAGLWLRADGTHGLATFFDNMSRRPIVGTTPWSRYFVDAKLSRDVEWLNYGVVLSGSGQVAVDNLRFLVWSSAGRWEPL